MSAASTPSVVRQIGSLFEAVPSSDWPTASSSSGSPPHRDAVGEAAFAALVGRHGPMVLDVCEQVLADRHDAEDAFQAVFLVLARKARSIRDPDLLGNWLYGVASARPARPGPARSPAQNEGRPRCHVRGGTQAACRAVGPTAEQPCWPASRPRLSTARSTACPTLSPAGRALLLRGPDPGRGGASAAMPGRNRAQPVGPGVRQAPPRADPPRRGVARGWIVSRRWLAAGLGVRLDVPVRHHARAAMSSAAGRAVAGASSAFAIALAGEVLRSMLIHKLEHIAVATLLLGALAAGLGYTSQASVRQPGQNDVQKGQAGKPDVQPIGPRADKW